MIALNTNLKVVVATTQFTNYDFSSFCNFKGKSLAANKEGLFQLGGGSDNGVSIDAYFEPVSSNWGALHPKRCRYFYFGYQASGPIRFSVGTFDALITPVTPNIQSRTRITLPRNIVQTYWSYRISNMNGHDFSIDTVEALLIRRSHGHSYHT